MYTSRPKSSLRLLCETAEVAKREGAEAFYAVFLRLNKLMNISKTNKSTIVPTQSMVNQQSPRASCQPAGGAVIDCSSGVVSPPRNRKGEEVSLFLNDRAIEQSIARSIERSHDRSSDRATRRTSGRPNERRSDRSIGVAMELSARGIK